MYDILLKAKLPCDNDDIRSSHTDALQECEEMFLLELNGFSTDTVEKHLEELKVSIESKLTAREAENERQTRELCEVLISAFKADHLDPVIQRLQGKDAARVSFKEVIDGYNKIKEDYHSSAIGARNVIATVFFEFHPKLKKEMDQQLALLGQLKDFDEELSRELAAKAYLESERKRLEEEQRRLQLENCQQKRQMEILIKSLEEERKRFQGQMKDEQQAQRQQLHNMKTASIKQAHEERKEFIKQRGNLNAQLKEMQEYNQQNMKKIKEMLEVAARHDKEKEQLLQQVNSETYEEKEALIKEMNDRHEQEMKVFRDEMNGKLNEVLASAPTIDKDMFRTPGLIKERTKAADDLRSKTKETQKARQEVEKPGVLKTVMEFVSGAVPVVGVAVGAFCPAVAPIVVPITSLVGAGAGFLAKNICSIM